MKVEFLGDHIHIDHGSGLTIDPAAMRDLWAFFGDLCREHDCGSILVEAEIPKRKMGTIDAFESGVEAAEIYPGLSVAICFYNYEPDEMTDLFVTSARNRGARVKFFEDKETALRWLGVRGKTSD
jgi:hypothetical protein